MSNPEICQSCPLTTAKIAEGGGEILCASLGGSSDFIHFTAGCLAVAKLGELGSRPGNFSELLQMFTLLTEDAKKV